MPVYRYRTFEEAEQDLWFEPGDPRIPQTLRLLWSMAKALTPHYPLPRGVQKFRSIEEANASREAWEMERLRWLLKERARVASKERQRLDPA